jgi:hypothetical protein
LTVWMYDKTNLMGLVKHGHVFVGTKKVLGVATSHGLASLGSFSVLN